jgi:hypothetical protein
MENYLGGNFPQSNNPEDERATRDKVLRESRYYYRFLSFWRKHEAETIIQTLGDDPNSKLILDSEAYSAYTESKRRKEKGLKNWEVKIDIDEYIQFIQAKKRYLDYYVNLDVINQPRESFENFLYMKKKGLDPRPVFHTEYAERDIGYLEYYLNHCNYIGIGAIADMTTKERIEKLDPLWASNLTDNNGYPRAKFHAFGIGSVAILKRYPWFSADATTWAIDGGFGSVLVPQDHGGQWIYTQNPQKIRVTVEEEIAADVKHIIGLPPSEQEMILRYFAESGYRYGEFDGFENGEPIAEVDGIFNKPEFLYQLNALFYVRLQESLPSYPWPFHIT